MTKVFVYGTLKKGEGNHGLLEGAKPHPYSVTTLDEIFDMFDGGFPYVLEGGSSSISGEVYDVDDRTLGELDRLEGVAHDHYKRLEVTWRDAIGAGKAIMYVATPNTAEMVRRGARRPVKPDDNNVCTWR